MILWALFFVSFLPLACFMETKEENERGSVIENEVSGRLKMVDGSAVNQAKLYLFPKNLSLSVPTLVDSSDVNGNFSLKSPTDPGQWSLLVHKGGNWAFMDSLSIDNRLNLKLTLFPAQQLELTVIGELQDSVRWDVLGTHFHGYRQDAQTFIFKELPLADLRIQAMAKNTQNRYTSVSEVYNLKPKMGRYLKDTLVL